VESLPHEVAEVNRFSLRTTIAGTCMSLYPCQLSLKE
jgi:hypothetical protein